MRTLHRVDRPRFSSCHDITHAKLQAMRTHIALLRGINVGGNKMVPMKELKAMFVDLGFKDAVTLLQSGNVVFSGKGKSRDDLENLLAGQTEKRLGVKCDYFVRTIEEWDEIIASNPFPKEAEEDPSHLLVAVQRDKPDTEELKAFQAAITGPE
ncbi:MAG: DUF1697 domain-containing protein, partial [Chlorobia bacterium]|nr:DUF1697 domain-containing protein [Fimbriimonadaceae bacterium]